MMMMTTQTDDDDDDSNDDRLCRQNISCRKCCLQPGCNKQQLTQLIAAPGVEDGNSTLGVEQPNLTSTILLNYGLDATR